MGAPAMAFCAALLLPTSPATAFAADFGLKLEPGFAVPLTAPQSSAYGVGVSQSFKGLLGLTPYLDFGPSGSFMLLPARDNHAEPGVAWGLGLGLRLKRPHDAESFLGISPWFDADALYIRTGDLNRPGFDLGLGFSTPIGESRTLWVGPFVRYLQVVQLSRSGFDNRDAKVLIFGISFEAGSGIERKEGSGFRVAQRKPAEHNTTTRYEEIRTITHETVSSSDFDHDGIVDSVDHCPEVYGRMEDFGCPVYKKVVVKKDKLELKEKLFFAWDQATLLEASYPIMDEVVRVLKENKGFRVQVEGHTDSSGADDHNQDLSERRATTVLEYLTSHGIPAERLVAKGFASSVPLDTNATVAGRENNRRVEFVVHFKLLNERDAK